MKKSYLIMAAIASVALASCSNEEYLGDNGPMTQNGNGAIAFSFDLPNSTRADLVGADAATALQSQFIVYATKHDAAELADASKDEVVFKNYKVEYTANSAGKTLSNTHNWEYVGLTPYAANVTPVATSQAIKYWDYSAAQGYTFYGIASKADITAGHVTIKKTTSVTGDGKTVYDKGYTVVLDKDATLDNLYVADRKPVAKTKYGDPVTLTFRSFGARVRVGFYETIPGYSVKINKFYYDTDASAVVTTFGAMENANTTNFTAALQNISKTPKDGDTDKTNTLTLSYYDNTIAKIENHVKLTPSTAYYDYALTLGTGVVGTTLATSSATPTWDSPKSGDATKGEYTSVYPFEDNANPMLIKVDYTLTSEDGSGETIDVIGANAVVPTQYVKWKSNFAYTYIFKIAPNTNGSTDPNDATKQGLYPITLDAVVVDVADDKTQETITTFAEYSITTYVNGSAVTTDNEYKKSKDIYVVKTDNASAGAVVAPSAIGVTVGNAQVYTATTSSTNPINEATVKAQLNGSPLGITLTAVDPAATLQQYAPAADGTNFDFGENGAVKFTPGAAGTYVYVFTRKENVPATYESAASATWSGSTPYYFKNTVGSTDVYYPAAGINADNFDANKANLYTQTSAGTAGEYDIKVIQVVD